MVLRRRGRPAAAQPRQHHARRSGLRRRARPGVRRLAAQGVLRRAGEADRVRDEPAGPAARGARRRYRPDQDRRSRSAAAARASTSSARAPAATRASRSDAWTSCPRAIWRHSARASAAGRLISGDDIVGTGARVAVISETTARRFFPRGDAVGQVLRIQASEWRVVGVIADIVDRKLDGERKPFCWVPFVFNSARHVVRGAGPRARRSPLVGSVQARTGSRRSRRRAGQPAFAGRRRVPVRLRSARSSSALVGGVRRPRRCCSPASASTG